MRLAYWISTALASLAILASALSYFFHSGTIEGVRDLGFPDHFRIQLGILKIIAAAVLLAPFAPRRIKEWAYAGVALFYVTAIVAHTAHGDPIALSLISVVNLIVLGISNATHHQLQRQ